MDVIPGIFYVSINSVKNGQWKQNACFQWGPYINLIDNQESQMVMRPEYKT